MAYERYDPRDEHRRSGDKSISSDDDLRSDRGSRKREHVGRGHDGRGFLERAGEEIASWFGDDPERGHDRDASTGEHLQGRPGGGSRDEHREGDRVYRGGFERQQESGPRRSASQEPDRGEYRRALSSDPRNDREALERQRARSGDTHEHWNDNRGVFARGGSSERDYDRDWQQEYSSAAPDRGRADRELDRGWTDRYQQVSREYGRGGGHEGRREIDPMSSQSKWAEDDYRRTSRAGSANWSDRSRQEQHHQSHNDRFDPHYHSWRDRHLSELDRDYDDFRAENQSRFESDFGSWRERRQQKRAILAQVHEHMEIVGSDGERVGTVERMADDRLILSKTDAESGGTQYSISCSEIGQVEKNRVVLECTADEARGRWRDESRGRALFEKDEQGEMGPRTLDRSFQGTYR